MDVSCDLEVDVNGEEIFILDKRIICSYSGRINKLFGKSMGSSSQSLKVIFHDFPGGAEGFELITRFCYNNGTIKINPSNLSRLYYAAHFMEMNKSEKFLEQTEKFLEEMKYWTWSELLVALKCQDLLPSVNSSGMLKKCLHSLVGLAAETSSCLSNSSPDSFDTRSTESSKNSSVRATWWFEDLVALNTNLIEMIILLMVSQNFNHIIISRFLFYYQKSRLVLATSDQKREITETVINMLYSLDWSAISLMGLFGILRVAMSLNISKYCRNKLESMIGSQMDQATLDHLLVPSPIGTNYFYDVNLVLRFLKLLVGKGMCCVPLVRFKKVASLMDLYIAEVAPDPCLKVSKFLELVRALPDSARDCYDPIYHAMDMYLEVHDGLSEEEKVNLCCGLNNEKLSSEACKHLAQNNKFPPKSAVQALTSQHNKLKNLLRATNQTKPFIDSSPGFVDIDAEKKGEACEQIVVYAGKIDRLTENEKLRVHLQGMQWRVMELEKLCGKMQTQMAKIMKSRFSKYSSADP
ncbi:phototropic-responsive NPH3 family protein [Actinidia rufa]|uniref:Phototropic-responsive NPH3 family protein n=1 Tax=Actinidia rufa TaxID=165716 RepID=A0A7J0GQ80_9ERIC|nr:phototropic-responsive NPH3 family protein [Actinidia rufa]